MRKITIFLILLAFIPCMVWASGGRENSAPSVAEPNPLPMYTSHIITGSTSESRAAMEALYGSSESAGYMNDIADAFDEITLLFCASLSPFPSVLGLFYGGDDSSTVSLYGDDFSLSQVMLSSDGYYELPTTMPFQGSKFETRTAAEQRSSWNMITVLFIAFFIAEVVFSAIYGYLTDRDGGVLKDIITKAVITILLFMLAAAVPFLIEAFRMGFVQMAQTLTGVNTKLQKMGATNDPLSLSKMDILNRTILKASVFEFPGLLIRNMVTTLDMMNPENISGTEGVSIWDQTDTSKIGALLIEFLYLIIKIVACIISIFAALHVMINVCEVYLLLGIVLCLLPFAVFTPTKWLGQNVVKSLISNTVELFVLLVIIYASFSISGTLMDALSSVVTSSIGSISLEFVFTDQTAYENVVGAQYRVEVDDTADGATVNPMIKEIDPETGEEVQRLRPIYINIGRRGDTEDKIGGGTAAGNESIWAEESILGDYKATQHDLENAQNLMNVIDAYFISIKNDTTKLTQMRTNYANLNPNATVQEVNELISNTNFVDLPTADKMEVIRLFEQTNTGSFEVRELGTTWGANPYDSNNFFVIHIVTCLLVIFMQTYFVNQSSHITNALLTGGVANESLSAAAYRFMFPKVMNAVTLPTRAAAGVIQNAARGHNAGGGGNWVTRILSGQRGQG